MILDLFAGPGGWDEGAKALGLRPLGIEWDMAACQTAMKAGHARVRADVATLPIEPFVGKVAGLIASPPCQDFSVAGKRAGIGGDKGQLIAQVLRWTDALRPRWVACEQVPPCLDVWLDYAELMREWGYRTWVGILNAADYGVPQTRKRAILLASLDRQPQRPEPTHARGGDDDLFASRAPWVSMAAALGWGMTERPATTLTAGSSRQGGPDPLDGGSGSRAALARERDAGRWVYDRPATSIACDPRLPGPGHRCFTDDCHPGRKATSMFDKDNGSVRVTVEQAAILQSFRPDYPWQGSKTKQFQQIGNAVPPRLAMHALAEVTGYALAADNETTHAA